MGARRIRREQRRFDMAKSRRENGMLKTDERARRELRMLDIVKKGKLPFKRVTIGYSLEYGIDEMEMHEDAVTQGERVILVDDLVATGGTAEAAVKLLKGIGAEVLAACFIIDLPDLGGAEKIRKLGVPVRTLLSFEGH